jgi:hypothetical protein
MSLRRFLIPALSVIVLACATLTASAQSGPIQGGKGAPQVGQPIPGQGLTADKAAALLQSYGHKAVVKTGANGTLIVEADVVKNGKVYFVDIHFTADGKFMDLFTNLGSAQNLSQGQLLALLQKNQQTPLNTYFGISTNGYVILNDVSYAPGTMSEQQFLQIVDRHIDLAQSMMPVLAVGQ